MLKNIDIIIPIMNSDVFDIICKRRSIRRFKQQSIPQKILDMMIDAARHGPSAANLQPLEYIAVNDQNLCKKIFPLISWAGYLPEWQPKEDEQPTAYVAILVSNENQWVQRDIGLASAHIVLAAEAELIGSCILCNIKKEPLKELLKIPDDVQLDSLIALGYKNENPVMEESDDTIKYYFDGGQRLHVPKKPIKSILHHNTYENK